MSRAQAQRILISGGRVMDPASGTDAELAVCIAEGRVIALGQQPADFTPDLEIQAQGHIVCPGLVDLSARLREPGQEHKATIRSELAAAARGGITTVCCPPDTHPVIDTPAVIELIQERAAEAGQANVLTIGALTQGLKGELLSEMRALKNAGCLAVSNASQPVQNALVLLRALEYAASSDLLVMIRPEDRHLANGGCVHSSAIATRLGLPGIPAAAETVAVAQALALIQQTGARAHFSQLSCEAAATLVSRVQYDGVAVSADVSIHQLHLTGQAVEGFNAACHVQPPLRSEQDRQALRQRLQGGVIAAICSDHQPHEAEAKLNAFPLTEPGISALETLLPLTLQLVRENCLTLMQAIERLTLGPARLLGLDAGALYPGAMADVCIFDPDAHWRVDAEHWLSRGHNTPFWGDIMTGQVTHTLRAGQLVFNHRLPLF